MPIQGLRFGTTTKFDFSPAPVVLAADITRFARNLEDFRIPLGRSVRQVMSPSFVKNFDLGGRPPWEPLADFTIEMRREQGFGSGPVLVRSGALKAAAGSPNIWSINEKAAIIQGLPANVWYGMVHQEGAGGLKWLIAKHGAEKATQMLDASIRHAMHTGQTIKASFNIPERPWAVIQPQDEIAIQRVFDLWLAERLARDVGTR